MKNTFTYVTPAIRLLALLTVLLLSTPSLQAQNRTVSGKVVSGEENTPLPGVNVILKGSTLGTVTNAEGEYRLQLPDGDGILSFSFIGYISQEIEVGNQSTINVTLSEDARQLSEVVVTGLYHADQA
ncbi:carboxypeptidase-like regulatory domain-containing protein [Catalinimonas niigatensis]|uniref:carboxypeptidase-like regulatory domain-containing protein n=1 Tax=Catalinimonas niigatensis TaxID=1397264 RepID=UPI002AA2A73F|nr:carboxypeptidase-like regulatory domain-containing protein [Catalinimonas niigatensis]WPP49436.1 carboxypeptidase-like regulatory domain-containing protein [Catalinimonas niigatensis]